MKKLEDAIHQAVNDCIKEGILKEILETQQKEAFNMVLTEFDEEKYEAIIREEGISIGIIKNLCHLVAKKKLTVKEALEECDLSEAEFIEKMQEYELDVN